MNSLQGGWGIQDRHDRVLSWLSAIVVSLLVLYALIFFMRQVMPPGGSARAATPTPAVTGGPRPPTARPTTSSRIPTRLATLPVTLPAVTRPPPTRPVLPSPSPRPPTPSAAAVLPTVAPPPTPPPTTRRLPAVRPATSLPPPPVTARAPSRRYFVRVGDAFASGQEALSFALEHDISDFKLTPASDAAGAALYLDTGNFRTQDEALRQVTRIRARLRNQNLPVVIRAEEIAGATPPPATVAPTRPAPTPAPTPAPSPTQVIPLPVTRVPTRVPPRPPTARAIPPRPTARPFPPPVPEAGLPVMSADEARDVLRRQHGWRPPSEQGYTVQVSSFRTLTNAVNFRGHLEAKGYAAHLDVAEGPGGAWLRVMVGTYPTLVSAQQAMEEFRARHGDSYQVFVRRW